jgi:hypothetical protein
MDGPRPSGRPVRGRWAKQSERGAEQEQAQVGKCKNPNCPEREEDRPADRDQTILTKLWLERDRDRGGSG